MRRVSWNRRRATGISFPGHPLAPLIGWTISCSVLCCQFPPPVLDHRNTRRGTGNGKHRRRPLQGLLYTYGLTIALKRITGRTRPDGSDSRSFPSGHTAGASCAAAVLWADHGPAAGIPAASLALYTCLSRVNMARHFPSDVVMGAAIGVACGIAATAIGDEGGEQGLSLSIFIDSHGRIHPGLW